jgi:hypothetical protein
LALELYEKIENDGEKQLEDRLSEELLNTAR